MPKSSRPKVSGAGSLKGMLFLGLAAMSLSGCAPTHYASNDEVTARTYKDRHPIVLTQAPTSTDIYPVGGRIDPLAAEAIRDFAQRYRTYGDSQVVILTPAGGRDSNPAVVAQIRKSLYANGLRGYVSLSSYPIPDPTLASPIRLVFQGVKAVVPSRCGQWPDDLVSGSSLETWKNENYHNFGCATQSVLAAQIDDPRDLVQGRAVTAPDETMRLRAIGQVRKGEDPGTNWKTQTTAIGSIGGGG